MTWKSVGRAHLLILIRHIIYSKKNYNYHYVTILFWLNFDTIWFSFIVHSTRKFVRFASLHNLTSSADKLCKSNDLQEDLAYKHPKLSRDHYSCRQSRDVPTGDTLGRTSQFWHFLFVCTCIFHDMPYYMHYFHRVRTYELWCVFNKFKHTLCK